jgi:hypothetical protein
LLPLPAASDNAAMQTEPPKPDPPKRKRRWYQFSLRTLLIVVTLLAVPLSYVGWQAKIVRERRSVADEITQHGGFVHWASTITDNSQPKLVISPRLNIKPPYPNVSWLRRLLGDDYVLVIISAGMSDEAYNRAEAVFPEAYIFRQ